VPRSIHTNRELAEDETVSGAGTVAQPRRAAPRRGFASTRRRSWRPYLLRRAGVRDRPRARGCPSSNRGIERRENAMTPRGAMPRQGGGARATRAFVRWTLVRAA
jgi:hypothetical protein